MSATLARPTLADTLPFSSPAARSVLLVVGASLLTALGAQVAIPLPFSPVPMTGQTLAVLLTGFALGARRGFAAQMLYLAQGACGLPVFAGGMGGVGVLLGPTGGYLLGFPLAAGCAGLLAERGWDRRPWTAFVAMLASSWIIFATGLAQLSAFVPREMLLQAGLFPFLPGDVVKALLAAALLPLAWKLAGRSGAPQV